jgi:ATP-binding protein involved in chromosome partitioning
VPLEPRLRECGDSGTPVVLADPGSASAKALRAVADKLAVRSRGLAGRSLNLSPVRR